MRRCELAALASAAVCGAFAVALLVLAEERPHFSILAAAFVASRALAGILVFAGLRLARHRSDTFSEGLFKLENLIAVVIGALVIIAAWELGTHAVVAFAAGQDILPEPLGSIPYLLTGSVLATILGATKARVAAAEMCPSLHADARHSYLDAVGLALMTVGALLAGLGVDRADELVAFLASTILFFAGGQIVLGGLKVLLDASVERSVLAEVERIVAADPRVSSVAEISGRSAGSYRRFILRLVTDETELAAAEALAEDLRKSIFAQVANVGEVLVEFIPAADLDRSAAYSWVAGAATGAARTATGTARAGSVPGAGTNTGEAAPAPTTGPRIGPAERAEIISTICSMAMAAAMIAVALAAGSIAVLAEGTDTVVDVVASVAVLAGMRLARHRSRAFPQGLYKVENVIAAGIGVLVLVSAYELGREAVRRLVEGGEALEQPLLVVLVMIAVVLVTALLGRYKARVGRKERSPSLQADARHTLSDAGASAGVLVGVGLQWAGVPHTDSIAALVVVGLLAWTGIKVVLEALRVLLDASLEPGILQGIRACAEEQPGVCRCVTVRGRNSGAYRFVTLTLVPDASDLPAAERVLARVRAAVRERFENVDRVDIELATH